MLDLEEVEREAEETMRALDAKLGGADKDAWFGAARCVPPLPFLALSPLLPPRSRLTPPRPPAHSSPSKVDALAYALLSIVSVLPPTCDKVLRPALERCPGLVAWVKAHDP